MFYYRFVGDIATVIEVINLNSFYVWIAFIDFISLRFYLKCFFLFYFESYHIFNIYVYLIIFIFWLRRINHQQNRIDISFWKKKFFFENYYWNYFDLSVNVMNYLPIKKLFFFNYDKKWFTINRFYGTI